MLWQRISRGPNKPLVESPKSFFGNPVDQTLYPNIILDKSTEAAPFMGSKKTVPQNVLIDNHCPYENCQQ